MKRINKDKSFILFIVGAIFYVVPLLIYWVTQLLDTVLPFSWTFILLWAFVGFNLVVSIGYMLLHSKFNLAVPMNIRTSAYSFLSTFTGVLAIIITPIYLYFFQNYTIIGAIAFDVFLVLLTAVFAFMFYLVDKKRVVESESNQPADQSISST